MSADPYLDKLVDIQTQTANARDEALEAVKQSEKYEKIIRNLCKEASVNISGAAQSLAGSANIMARTETKGGVSLDQLKKVAGHIIAKTSKSGSGGISALQIGIISLSSSLVGGGIVFFALTSLI